MKNELFTLLFNLLNLFDHNITFTLFRIIEDILKHKFNLIKALIKKEDLILCNKYK